MNHFPAFICENGHAVSVQSRVCTKKFCNCGKPVVSQCANCGSTIPGRPVHEYIGGSTYVPPAYCDQCGKPYPWTSIAIESTMLALKESRELSDTVLHQIGDILSDVITETPKTSLAAVRISNVLNKSASFAADCLRQFVINHGCDLILSILNL